MTTEVVQTTSGKASSRPTDTVVIGGTKYTALCPKMAVWVTAVNAVNEAADKVNGNALDAATQLHDVLVGDDADPRSTGILVQALEPEDVQDLVTRLTDRRDELDMPDLWFAAIEILGLFEDWVQAQGKAMGLKIPKLVKTAGGAKPVNAGPAKKAAAPRKRAR